MSEIKKPNMPEETARLIIEQSPEFWCIEITDLAKAYQALQAKREELQFNLDATEKVYNMNREYVEKAKAENAALEFEISELKDQRRLGDDVITGLEITRQKLQAKCDELTAALNRLDDSKEMLWIENKKLKNALNRIGMLGRSEIAYTSEFTEKVTSIVQKVLNS